MLETNLSNRNSAPFQKDTAGQVLLSHTDRKCALEVADLETVGYGTCGGK